MIRIRILNDYYFIESTDDLKDIKYIKTGEIRHSFLMDTLKNQNISKKDFKEVQKEWL